MGRLAPGLGREALRLIDATRIHAGKTVRHWAIDGAIKPHVVFGPIAQRTARLTVTSLPPSVTSSPVSGHDEIETATVQLAPLYVLR